MYKKVVLLAAIMLLTLSGCSQNKTKMDQTISENTENNTNDTFEAQKQEDENENKVEKEEKDMNLYVLCKEASKSCYTKEGYYYLSEEPIELVDGEAAMNLMYMDFATKQEIYLCSDSGCQHNSINCSSVFSMKEFLWGSCIFVWNNHLYLLSKEPDDDGSTAIDYMGDDSGMEIEAQPTTLYCMDLNGSNRKNIYTFESGITLEDSVLGDDQSLYFITKKLSNKQDGNQTYTASTERKLVRLIPKNCKLEEVCSLDFHDGLKWKLNGCEKNQMVFQATEYANGRTEDDIMGCGDSEWKEIYDSSQTVYLTLNLETLKKKELYRYSNQTLHSSLMKDEYLYLVEEDTGVIDRINVLNGNMEYITTFPQCNLYQVIDHMLCCQKSDSTKDSALYFIDLDTKEVKSCPLVNKSLGWPLELKGETKDQVLVIYDYEAKSNGDDSYEILKYQYGLIKKEALVKGLDQFEEIQMVGKGR